MSRSMPRTACTVSVLLTTKSLVSPRVWIMSLPRRVGTGASLSGVAVSSCPLLRGILSTCPRRPPGSSPSCRCCRPAATGRARRSPTGSASARGPCAATSTACASSATPCTRARDPTAGTGSTRAPRCRRSCSTTSRRSPSSSPCRPRPRASRGSTRPPSARSRRSARSCPPGCGPRPTRSRSPPSRAAADRPQVDQQVLLTVGAAVRAHEVLRFDYDGRQRHPASPVAPRPTTWSPGAAAGTSSATTSTAPTGAPTASTA